MKDVTKISDIRTETLDFWGKKDLISEIEIPKFLTRIHTIKDGSPFLHIYCQKCGAEYDVLYSGSRMAGTSKCNVCGNDEVFSSCQGYPYVFMEKEDDDNFKIALASVTYAFKSLGNSARSDYTSTPAGIVTISWYLTCENGRVVVIKSDGRISRSDRKFAKFKDYASGLYKDTKYVGTTKEEFRDLVDRAVLLSLTTAEKKSKKPSKLELLEMERKNIKLKDWTPFIEKMCGNFMLSTLISDYPEKVFAMSCTCGNVFNSNTVDVSCPSCGASEKVRSYSYHSHMADKKYAFFENTNLTEGDLLIRVYTRRLIFDVSKPESERWSCFIREDSRVYMNRRGVFIYNVDSGVQSDTGNKYNSLTKSKVCYGLGSSTVFPQKKDDVKEIIDKSALNRIGLCEALGLSGKKHGIIVMGSDILEYVKCVLKAPCIELMLKAGLINASREFLGSTTRNYKETLAVKASTLDGVFGVSKRTVKLAQALDWDINTIKRFDRLVTEDQTFNTDLYDELKEKGISYAVETIIELKEMGISCRKIIDYLDSVYDHQCIDRQQALHIWRDYLRMAKRIGVDLSDKTRKFPTSLKKEHDVATFAYNKIRDEIDREALKTAAEKTESRFGNYSYKDLFIVTPKTPEEIVFEASSQKNCLRSYISSLKEGRTNVVFIRRKDEPDKSFVTCEVNNDGRLVQVKGYCNSNPTSPELADFLTHWTSAKKISR